MRSIRFVRSVLFAPALFTLLTLAAPAPSFAQLSASITIAPPPLPAYEQPICPGDGYLWTPGYWAWDGSDYYWVPGTWVMLRKLGSSGLRVIGVGAATDSFSMKATGGYP